MDVAPRTVSGYLDPTYWEERFSSEEHYEWLKDYSHFRHLLTPLLSPSLSVLELGCGNSRLSEELRQEGVADITCIDLASAAVERMKQRLSDKGISGIKVLVADMLDLPFEPETFDLVIEKGTMDVLFVDSGDPWNPNPANVSKVMKMLEGIHKVLKQDGVYISISFGQPHFRRKFFDAPNFTWSVEYNKFGDSFHYFFYILKKGKRSLDYENNQNKPTEKPSVNLFQDELEGEDFLFRTAVDEL
ncbi:Endothelin-converting enzyme 2 [Carex littledalei]|uniref:EEF1A lysine methyltransferase 4 n=1 Tax=Carex littledalei TaxID=544730 RepID=A0A833QQU7_9POAL|nr:Endothelin-converting enzyme 2 [Carex littledalei]